MGVPILPKDSGVLGRGVLGTMTLGVDFTPITDLTSVYIDHTTVLIEIYTAAFVMSGVVDNYEYFQYVANLFDFDTFEIDINAYKMNVSAFVSGGFIRFVDGGVEHIGIIESIEKPLDKDGKGSETWKITGRGVEAILAQRICMTGTATSTGFNTLNGKAETVGRTIVDNECINPADTNRVITGLSLAADGALGATVDRSLRFEYVHEVLYGICKEVGVSFRLVHGTGLAFVLTWYAGTDVSATVVITPDYGNVETFKYVESLLEKKNLLYVGGTGDAAARVVRECYDTTEPTGWTRREKFVDASDCTTNDLIDARGAETLATTGESLTLEAEYLESPTFTLNTHFHLGDTVTVYWPNTVTSVNRITSITYEWDAGTGKTIKLGLGKEAPDLKSIMKLKNRLDGAQARR